MTHPLSIIRHMSDSNDKLDEIHQIEHLLQEALSGFDPGKYSHEDLSVFLSSFGKIERLSGAAKAMVASGLAEAHRLAGPSDRSDAHKLAQMENITITEEKTSSLPVGVLPIIHFWPKRHLMVSSLPIR